MTPPTNARLVSIAIYPNLNVLNSPIAILSPECANAEMVLVESIVPSHYVDRLLMITPKDPPGETIPFVHVKTVGEVSIAMFVSKIPFVTALFLKVFLALVTKVVLSSIKSTKCVT